ncbi:MAG: TonB-dependent receptor, partial [Schleiferiaceae bacterium]|nr:TonB-dependent receptor [Schleiferiaceae bacterium]
MNRILFLLSSMLGFALFVQSQTITVLDAHTGQAVDMVTITSQNPRAIALTNTKGQADISAFKDAQQIVIKANGYHQETHSFGELKTLLFKVLLTPKPTLFDREIVVSATRWRQNTLEVPTKITSLSREDVALFNPQTAADLLGQSGEVFIQKSQQGGGSPMIRGFSTNRLLYSIDGVRMNTAIFRSGNLQNVISLDPFAIETTEVLFGPGSIIYGSDAIGGVMSFQTLSPQLSFEDSIQVKGGSASRYSSANNEITNHFNVSLGSKKWATVTSITHSKFGNLRMGRRGGPDEYLRPFTVVRIDSVDRIVDNPDPHVQDPTGYSQMNLMQKVRFRPNSKWDFEYAFHYSETSEYSRYDRLIETRDGLPRSAVWNYGPQIWMMNYLKTTYSEKTLLFDNLTLRLAQQYFEESRIDRNFSGGNRFRLRTQLEEVMAYSVNSDFEKRLGNHRLLYGVEYIFNDVQSKGTAVDIRTNDPVAVPDRYPKSQWQSYAVYVNYLHQFSKKLNGQAGLRFNGFDVNSDFTRHLAFYDFDFTNSRTQNSATTGSIGIVYRPSNSWRITGNLSTGFRAPNVDDMGKIFDFVANQVVVPNTNLAAEYAYNADVNVSKAFGKHLKVDASGFYTYLDNAMVRRPFQVNGQDSIIFNGEMSQVNAIQNAAYGTVYGFNLGIAIFLPNGITITSKFNYQRGIEEDDQGNVSRSRHAAPAFGITRI